MAKDPPDWVPTGHALEDIAGHILVHEILGISDLIATGGSAPDTSGPELFWLKDDANPHIVHVKLNNSGGTAEWVQFAKGTGGGLPD